MDLFVRGTYYKNIFLSSSNYLVGLIKVTATNDPDLEEYIQKTLTITGNVFNLIINEEYIFYGDLVHNEKYGLQYQIKYYQKYIPEGKEGIINFLASGMFSGIGIKTAQKIVDLLGEDAVEKIKNNHRELLLISGMTEMRAIKIKQVLDNYQGSYESMLYLNNLGFSSNEAIKIYNRYQNECKNVIENNIYKLVKEIDGITFNKVDQIAIKKGVDSFDLNRLTNLIIFVMQTITFQNGDTYSYFNEIYGPFLNYLKRDFLEDDFKLLLDDLIQKNLIVNDKDRYYLYEYYEAENYLSNILYYLINQKDNTLTGLEKEIISFELKNNIKFNNDQKTAIKKALQKRISIITGGPGTGKTTIIKAITEIYKKNKGYSYEKLLSSLYLLAPTGRASKRMSETCNYPATTIHRFLKWNKDDNSFAVNDTNKSSAKFLIIDEVSMIDTMLFMNLFKGLERDVQIVLIGDYNQLESVGPGNILKDLIQSDFFDTIFLKEIYRQKEDSYIPTLASEVNQGIINPDFNTKAADYSFISCPSNHIIQALCELCTKALEKGYNEKDIQVLIPLYKGINGIDNANKKLQDIFNPAKEFKKEVKSGEIIYRVNDKILQLENMIDNNVFNGDIGFIKEIDNNTLYIDFDGNVVKYDPKDFKSIIHGYAISIHKAQGSEFKMVILPITNSYHVMLYRKIVYTAISRAKQNLTILGSKEAFLYAVADNASYERKTGLKEKLLSFLSTQK